MGCMPILEEKNNRCLLCWSIMDVGKNRQIMSGNQLPTYEVILNLELTALRYDSKPIEVDKCGLCHPSTCNLPKRLINMHMCSSFAAVRNMCLLKYYVCAY